MDNLSEVFYITLESIGVLNSNTLGNHLKKVKSYNQKDLPKWISEFSPQPLGITSTAIVDRFSIIIPGARTAFVDIHEIDGVVSYAKIFFLFGVHQIIKIKKYEKLIDSLTHKNLGSPNMTASLELRPLIGNSCLVYFRGNIVVNTINMTAWMQKEFQIHIYEDCLFKSSFNI